MDTKEFLLNLWENIEKGQFSNLRDFYNKNAEIFFPNTRELFLNLDSYIEFNEKYPGSFNCKVEKILENHENTVAIIKVYNDSISHYCTAFYSFTNKKITKAIEYWSENLDVPTWRKDLGLTQIIENYEVWA